MGNLTREPETRHTTNGKVVCSFGLAVRDWGDKTTFVDVTAWGKTAEHVQAHINKGRQVGVSGRLSMDQWDDRETGKKRSKLYITADAVTFGQGSDRRQMPQGEAPQQPAPQADPVADVPF